MLDGRTVDEGQEPREHLPRVIATRSDKLARNYHAGLCLAATLQWLSSSDH
ncbi:hypothetical protein [Microbacterium lacticum]